MAYGKDKSQLSNVPNFRAAAQNYEQHKARPPSGGGGRPTWIDKFNPSTDTPDEIRILRGNYEVLIGVQTGVPPTYSIEKQILPYYPFVEHFHGGLKRGCVCSAGPFAAFKDKRDECPGCDQHWAERSANRGTKNKGAMARRDMYSFSVLHYAPYAYIEQRDRDTMQIRTDDNGKPYMEWVRILPNERNDPKFQGKEKRDAHVLHWDIGFGHWNTLLEYDKEIGQSCRACGGRDTIVLEAWLCPACGTDLIDPNTTTYKPEELADLLKGEVTCASCKEVVRLTEAISCKGCNNAERADIFDVDMRVKRVAPPDGGNQTTLMVPGWSNPRGIDQRFVDLAKPLDLKKIFTPTPPDKQREIFKMAEGSSPAIAQAGGRSPVVGGHSRPYVGNK